MLTKEGISTDMGAQGRPIWHLSCYAPARGEPNLIEGVEVSPDEDRVLAYQAKQSGQEAAYLQHVQTQTLSAEQMYQNASMHPQNALQKAIANRQQYKQTLQPAMPAFGAASSSAPAFGSAAQPPSSAFGAAAPPSAFGAPSAFGSQPSAFGSVGKPSAFGQPLSLIHISEPTRPRFGSRMPSSA